MNLSRNQISAIVVTYHPSSEFIDNLNALMTYYSYIIIVDNTEAEAAEDNDVFDELRKLQSVHMISNGQNLGIAKALNQGVEKARNIGAEWVTTFDQDSKLLCDIPSLVLTQNAKGIKSGYDAIIGANYADPVYDLLEHKVVCADLFLIPASDLISSGMSFPISVFDQVGGFDDQLFIDMVDHDFCIKATLGGVSLFKTSIPIMSHSVGQKSKHYFLWKTLFTNNHSALRRYYYARNTLVLSKRYFLKSFTISARHFLRLMKLTILVILFEDNKKLKLYALCKGVVDGLRGNLGSAPKNFS